MVTPPCISSSIWTVTWSHRKVVDVCCSQFVLSEMRVTPLWPSVCSYSVLAEAINSLLVFTQQPLLPPLDIFGCFCDQEAGRGTSDRGRMSIKSSGSPPTLPYSNTLNSGSANMWTILLLRDWLCCDCVVLSVVSSHLCDQRDITAAQRPTCRGLSAQSTSIQKIHNRYLETQTNVWSSGVCWGGDLLLLILYDPPPAHLCPGYRRLRRQTREAISWQNMPGQNDLLLLWEQTLRLLQVWVPQNAHSH